MKRLLFLLSIIISNITFGQDTIMKNVDQFNGKITFFSPMLNDAHASPVIFQKIITNDTVYYVWLNSCASTPNSDTKGVIILFSDGTKLEKPEEEVYVDVAPEAGCDYNVHSLIRLSDTDIIVLKTKSIKAFRQYIYDKNIDNGYVYVKYFNALLTAH